MLNIRNHSFVNRMQGFQKIFTNNKNTKKFCIQKFEYNNTVFRINSIVNTFRTQKLC